MSTNRARVSWRATVAAVVASAVIGVGAWGAMGADSEGGRPLDAQAERIMHGRETVEFQNLEQLVGSTPYIVKATVTAIQPGRSIGTAEDGGADQARDVTLSVETNYRKPSAPPSTLVVEEWGWDEEGAGYQVENVAWSKVGDTGYYFLTVSTVPGRYKLVNTQGRALETADSFLKWSADPESELVRAVGWMDSIELHSRIKYLLQPENRDQLETVQEPPAAPSASQTAPAPDDGSEEPYPDDSVDDGSEPSPSATPTSG